MPPACIEIAFSDERLDSTGISAKSDIEEDLGIRGVEKARFSELYYIDLPDEMGRIGEIAEKVFLDPIVQKHSLGPPIFKDYDFYIEVRLHNDVTDNLGMVAKEAIEDYLGRKAGGTVRSAKRYYLTGRIKREDAEKMARKLFANEIIETFTVAGKNE